MTLALPGTQFKLTDEDTTADKTHFYNASGTGSTNVSVTYTTSSEEGQAGIVDINGELVPGHTYDLVEEKPVDGYANVPGTLAKIEVSETGEVTVKDVLTGTVTDSTGEAKNIVTAEKTEYLDASVTGENADKIWTITVRNQKTEIVIDKVNSENKYLTGAVLELYGKAADKTNFTKESADLFTWDNTTRTVTVTGLTQGTVYWIKETTRPPGYNDIGALYFKLDSEIDGNGKLQTVIQLCNQKGETTGNGVTGNWDAALGTKKPASSESEAVEDGKRHLYVINHEVEMPITLRKVYAETKDGSTTVTNVANVLVEINKVVDGTVTKTVYGMTDANGILRPYDKDTKTLTADEFITFVEGSYTFKELEGPDNVYVDSTEHTFTIEPADYVAFLAGSGQDNANGYVRNMMENGASGNATQVARRVVSLAQTLKTETKTDATGATSLFVNDVFSGHVVVKKYDTNRYDGYTYTHEEKEGIAATALSGMVFALEKKTETDGVATYEKVKATDGSDLKIVSNDNGYLHINGDNKSYVDVNEKGTYRLVEVTSKGYTGKDETTGKAVMSEEFTLTNDNHFPKSNEAITLGDLYNIRKTGTIQIKKVDEDNNETEIKDTTFILYRKNTDKNNFFVNATNQILEFVTGNRYTYDAWSTMEVDSSAVVDLYNADPASADSSATVTDGVLEIAGLEWGTYILVETKAADGYHLKKNSSDNQYTFEVSQDTVDSVIKLDGDITNAKNKVTFKKMGYAYSQTDQTGAIPLTGGTFRVFDAEDMTKPVQSFTISNKDGTYVIEGLPGGVTTDTKTYVIHEETAPSGYAVSPDIYFTLNGYGQIADLQDKNVTEQQPYGRYYEMDGDNNLITMYDDSTTKVTVQVEKKFDESILDESIRDLFAANIRPQQVEVALYKYLAGESVSDAVAVTGVENVTLTAAEDWKNTTAWTDLPAYEVVAKDGGETGYRAKKIVYTLKENGKVVNALYDYETTLEESQSTETLKVLTVKNTLKSNTDITGSTAYLDIHKVNTGGPQDEVFNVAVELFLTIDGKEYPLGEADKDGNVRYKGVYQLMTSADSTSGVEANTTEEGLIQIQGASGSQFARVTLPIGVHFRVREVLDTQTVTEKTEYQTSYTWTVGEEGDENFSKGSSSGEAGASVIDANLPTGQLPANGADVIITNSAVIFTQIENETPEVRDTTDNDSTRGGSVSVTKPGGGEDSDSSKTDWNPNSLIVSWEPDENWLHSSSFTVEYKNYSAENSKVETITVTDYLDENGSPKAKEDSCYDELRSRYKDFDIYKQGDKIYLELADTTQGIPYSNKAVINFIPTLAVENTTENDGGGVVRVEDGVDGASSDGKILKDTHNRYVQSIVYGTADDGYVIDMDNLTIGNVGDLDGTVAENAKAVKLKLTATGNADLFNFVTVLPYESKTAMAETGNGIVHLLDAIQSPFDLGTVHADDGSIGTTITGTVEVLARNARREATQIRITIQTVQRASTSESYIAMPLDVGIAFKPMGKDTPSNGGSGGDSSNNENADGSSDSSTGSGSGQKTANGSKGLPLTPGDVAGDGTDGDGSGANGEAKGSRVPKTGDDTPVGALAGTGILATLAGLLLLKLRKRKLKKNEESKEG